LIRVIAVLVLAVVCAPAAAAQDTEPTRRVSAPGALLDDYDVVEPRSFTFSVGAGYVKVPFGYDVWMPATAINIGLTSRVDIGLYSSVAKVAFEDFKTTAKGDSYLNAKIVLVKEGARRPGIAFQPVLEVLGRPSLANNALAPKKVNAAFGGIIGKSLWDNIRVYNHTGYFTRGIVFTSAAMEFTRFSRFTPSIWGTWGRLTRNRDYMAENLANVSRLDAGGTIGFPIGKGWSAYVGAGRSWGRRDFNSTEIMIGGAVSYTWRPFAQ